ncbi:MAG TPA: GDP-mannose 4,6-dehydratase [Candidatus Eisenbacteria bacterium]|nr:GDP-mannose 4,6-dehydratase [Candidatus Eisenbacteria bacterium]
MQLLITGITGFVGSYMAEHALAQGVEVFGSIRWRSKTDNIDHLRSKVTLIESDLRDLSSVRALLEAANPTHVIHLAAQSFVHASWKTPAETLTTNILAQVNLLEGLRGLKMSPRFLVVGSSEEYGLVEDDELPIKETNPLRPLSPYAVSKVGQDLMGYQYWKSYGMLIIRSRAFNHEGPRRGDVFVTSNFARQIAEIEAGLRDPVIFVGDLTPRRDYSDVRDIVRGYWTLLERGEPGEVYNLCSGRSWSIQQVLDFLLEQSRVKDIKVQVEPSRLRPSDVRVLEGDPSKVEKATGWKVEIPFERTLKDLLAYWRQRTWSSSR